MIAVLLATYNGEKYLPEQLDSILKQTYNDFKIYIHDDGSSDRTVDILHEYSEKYPDKIEILDGAPTGAAQKNFLYMLHKVENEYYMFSDQDDVWLPEKMEKLMKLVKKNETDGSIPTLAFSDMKVVDKDLNVLDESFVYVNRLDTKHLSFPYLICQNVVAGCTTLFNRALRDEALKYKNAGNIEWHDWWIALIAAANDKLLYLNEKLSLYRQHENNTLGSEKDIGIKKNLEYVYFLITFSHIGKTKIRIHAFVVQTQELKNIKMTERNREIVEMFMKFDSYNKLAKLKNFHKYGIRRSKRNLWQSICL